MASIPQNQVVSQLSCQLSGGHHRARGWLSLHRTGFSRHLNSTGWSGTSLQKWGVPSANTIGLLLAFGAGFRFIAVTVEAKRRNETSSELTRGYLALLPSRSTAPPTLGETATKKIGQNNAESANVHTSFQPDILPPWLSLLDMLLLFDSSPYFTFHPLPPNRSQRAQIPCTCSSCPPSLEHFSLLSLSHNF